MNEARALVSVIIPVFNGERHLAEALRSALAQSYAPLEVIVVDDGSGDGTKEIALAEPDIIYIRQKNQGVAVARNTGVTCSRGSLLAFLDADDLWALEKIERQVEFLREHPEVGLTFTNHRLFLDSGTGETPSWVRPELLEGAHPGCVPSALVVRREVFEAVGPFDPDYRVAEDSDWFFRARDYGAVWAVLPETLLFKRVHQDNLSSQVEESRANLLKVVRSSVARRRTCGEGE